MYNRDEQPIIAQCTPSGAGALAIIRISGINTRVYVQQVSKLYGSKSILNVDSHTIHAGWILDGLNNKIDQVMFLVMDGPKTFTGQDTIEITCHNNPFIIQNIIDTIISSGARLATNGEFTMRAFLNKKIDLVQAEAINELISANTEEAIKKSLSQLEGTLSNWINKLEQELIRTLAWCEASFEFIDEEQEFGQQIKNNLTTILEQINKLKKQYESQKHIKTGIRIALLGAVNAGKSTIFNALVGSDRAIVTPIAGTTRDIIESGTYQNGTYVTYIDTAGLRTTDDFIEQEGIKRSYAEAQKADIILLVFDGSKNLTSQEYEVYMQLLKSYNCKIIVISNKADLLNNLSLKLLNNLDELDQKKSNWKMTKKAITKHQLKNYINCFITKKDSSSIDKLKTLIKDKIDILLKKSESPYIINKRHFSKLIALEIKLIEILNLINQNPQYEVISYKLRDAIEELSQLTGKTVTEAGLDQVFKEFCVGK
jgi:tRNA modification GTPase